jgi:hypothetical protein
VSVDNFELITSAACSVEKHSVVYHNVTPGRGANDTRPRVVQQVPAATVRCLIYAYYTRSVTIVMTTTSTQLKQTAGTQVTIRCSLCSIALTEIKVSGLLVVLECHSLCPQSLAVRRLRRETEDYWKALYFVSRY